MTLAVGVCLPQFVTDPQVTLAAARDIEALGFDSVSLYDHLQPLGGPPHRPILDCFTMLAAVASVTERIGLRSLVARATLRPPAMTAHLAHSLHELSGGRFVLGVGGGDPQSDNEDVSVGLPAATFQQRHDAVRAVVERARVQAPAVPVWVGGTGPTLQRLAGALGVAAWNGWGLRTGEVATGLQLAEEAALAVGATPPVATWGGTVLVAADEETATSRRDAWAAKTSGRDVERLVWGDPAGVAAQLRALAGAGVVEVLCSFVGGEVAEQRRVFAEQVRPLL